MSGHQNDLELFEQNGRPIYIGKSRGRYRNIAGATQKKRDSFVTGILNTLDPIIAKFLSYVDNPDHRLRQQGIAVYDKTLGDSVVQGCKHTLTESVNALDFEIIKNKATAAEKTLAEELVRHYLENGFREKCLSAILFGNNYIDLDWNSDRYFFVPYNFVVQPRSAFTYKRNSETRRYDLYYYTDNNQTSGELVPERKLLVPTYDANESNNPYGVGLLSSAFKWAFIKEHVINFWTIFVEELGTPKIDVGISEQLTMTMVNNLNMSYSDIIPEIDAAMDNLRQDGRVVHFDGLDIKTLETGKADHGATHNDLINKCDEQLSILFLGHTGTSKSTAGKLGGEHSAMFNLDARVQAFGKFIAAQLNQMLSWVNYYNFSNTQPPTVRIYDANTRDNKRVSMYRDMAEVDGKLTAMGVKYNEEYFQHKYNIDPQHFELIEPTPPPNKQGNHQENHQDFINGPTMKKTDSALKTIDQFIENIDEAKTNHNLMSRLVQPLFEFAEEKDKLEELLKSYHRLYPKMKDRAWTDRIQGIYFGIYCYGYISSQNEDAASEKKEPKKDNAVGQRDLREFFNRDDFPQISIADLQFAIDLEPKEAVEYFRSKGIEITFDWKEAAEAIARHAFTVSGVMKLDVLMDFKSMIQRALAEGWSMSEFRSNMQQMLQTKGWLAKKDGKSLNSPWRMQLIYQNNVMGAYSESRWDQMKNTADVLPYVLSLATNNGMNPTTTKACKALHNKVFKKDDKYYSRNLRTLRHHRCQSREVSISETKIKKDGLTVSTGAAFRRFKNQKGFIHTGPWKPDMKKYPSELAKQFESSNV